jgi:hypothetical protein
MRVFLGTDVIELDDVAALGAALERTVAGHLHEEYISPVE